MAFGDPQGLEQATFEEIAEAMDAPVGTAKTRVRLANAFLAEGLAKLGSEAPTSPFRKEG